MRLEDKVLSRTTTRQARLCRSYSVTREAWEGGKDGSLHVHVPSSLFTMYWTFIVVPLIMNISGLAGAAWVGRATLQIDLRLRLDPPQPTTAARSRDAGRRFELGESIRLSVGRSRRGSYRPVHQSMLPLTSVMQS